MKIRGFYFITDKKLSRKGVAYDVKSALAAGVRVIQYRNTIDDSSELFCQALALRKICRRAFFLVNNRIDIALAVGADGVHLGQKDLPLKIARKVLGKNKIIGVTVHNLKEAKIAQKDGADYLGVAPIFLTHTKLDARSPVGVGLIRKIKKNIALPVVAVGGINLANARQVIASKADSLAAVSAVVSKANVKKEILKFQKLF